MALLLIRTERGVWKFDVVNGEIVNTYGDTTNAAALAEARAALQIVLAKTAAKILNFVHRKYCAGFYGSDGGRYFAARARAGALEVSPDFGNTWVPAPAAFRTQAGAAIEV